MLGTPPAFVLSQDQTLYKNLFLYRFFKSYTHRLWRFVFCSGILLFAVLFSFRIICKILFPLHLFSILKGFVSPVASYYMYFHLHLRTLFRTFHSPQPSVPTLFHYCLIFKDHLRRSDFYTISHFLHFVKSFFSFFLFFSKTIAFCLNLGYNVHRTL